MACERRKQAPAMMERSEKRCWRGKACEQAAITDISGLLEMLLEQLMQRGALEELLEGRHGVQAVLLFRSLLSCCPAEGRSPGSRGASGGCCSTLLLLNTAARRSLNRRAE